ncbi:glycoside hydrolase family 18 protein [Tilletiaria anomala UBC 951]|uniref:Glycoside hydrolase family 18 protein n=1 Tax=Tilletiaria anomala (strain ATCC 24038 / CBS 436.72 / UBC 951) TaxID=1037660 RepID=A0A066VPK4_TILAU|nr:glycoside hydrolase family 18 protein [Tilletiaria anomala UBC 951]KDN40515.1 glycoside hydrolase family 18 protein [Tilletiaria anomala UBC 951]
MLLSTLVIAACACAEATRAAAAALSSSTASVYPLDLHGKFPSAETIAANASQGLDATALGSTSSSNLISNHTRFLPRDRTVLAYVTPWNQPQGRENTEHYRGKLDIVAPAWYTVHVVPETEQAQHAAFESTGATGGEYDVRGGIPSDEDRAWVHRLRAPARASSPVPGAADVKLPPLLVTPRFQLEAWTERDFQALRSDPLRWISLIGQIMMKMKDGPFDGAVFESAASWALPEFIEHLGKSFASNNLTLTVVYPPLRTDGAAGNANVTRTAELLAQAIHTAAQKVQYVQIMTYDHTGPTGRMLDMDKLGLADENPLRQDAEASRMRTYGPNLPLEFLQSNIDLLAKLSLDDGPLPGVGSGWKDLNGAAADNFNASAPSFASKFLMGVPCYGYSYSLIFLNSKTADGIPRVPTASPPRARAHLPEAQAKAREQGLRKEAGKFALLRRAGSALKHADLHALMLASRPLIYLDDDSAEMRFDYISANGDDSKINDGRREGIFNRAFMPSAYTMIRRREIIEQGDVGAALWDIGQAGPWLLHAL